MTERRHRFLFLSGPGGGRLVGARSGVVERGDDTAAPARPDHGAEADADADDAAHAGHVAGDHGSADDAADAGHAADGDVAAADDDNRGAGAGSAGRGVPGERPSVTQRSVRRRCRGR